jgi:hypothetical protein
MRLTHIDKYSGYFLVIGLLFLLFLLTACGTNTGTTTVSNASSVTATVPPKQQPVQACGTVHTLNQRLATADQKSAAGIEDCFLRWYQQCQPATLIYAQSDVDTSTLHTFSFTDKNKTCVITDTLQHVVVPHAPKPVGSYPCFGLEQKLDGLHFLTCGTEGTIIVPQE